MFWPVNPPDVTAPCFLSQPGQCQLLNFEGFDELQASTIPYLCNPPPPSGVWIKRVVAGSTHTLTVRSTLLRPGARTEWRARGGGRRRRRRRRRSRRRKGKREEQEQELKKKEKKKRGVKEDRQKKIKKQNELHKTTMKGAGLLARPWRVVHLLSCHCHCVFHSNSLRSLIFYCFC